MVFYVLFCFCCFFGIKYLQMLNIIALATVLILVIYFYERIELRFGLLYQSLGGCFIFFFFLLFFFMLLQIVAHLDYGLSGRLLRTSTPKAQVTLINGHALLFVLISPALEICPVLLQQNASSNQLRFCLLKMDKSICISLGTILLCKYVK